MTIWRSQYLSIKYYQVIDHCPLTNRLSELLYVCEFVDELMSSSTRTRPQWTCARTVPLSVYLVAKLRITPEKDTG